MEEADTKTCPICAEEVKAAAQRCRYCGHDFTGRAAHRGAPIQLTNLREKRRLGCGAAIVIFFAVALVYNVINPPPAPAPPQPPRDPAPCNRIIAEAGRARIIRSISSNRIDVEDLRWAALPASDKRALLAAWLCSHLGGRAPTAFEDYVVAYGYRSGRRVGMAGEFGVTLE